MQTLILYFIILALFLLLAFFFSSAETAFMALNRLRLKYQADAGDRKAQQIKEILSNPDRLLGIILVGSTVSNIAAASLVTYLVAEYAPQGKAEAVSVVASLCLTLVVLICCELTPKIIAAAHPDEVTRKYLWPVRLALVLLSPFARVSAWIARGLVKMIAGSTPPPAHSSTR